MLDGAEISRHKTADSCWLVINSRVYDVTSFLHQHPGGAATLLGQGGSDVTAEFNKIHSPSYVNDLPEGSYLGEVDPDTVELLGRPKLSLSGPEPTSGKAHDIHPLSLCITVRDFEGPAKAVLSHKSWIYVSSSANSGLSLERNLNDWSRLTFRPRVLRNVESVDSSTAFLGHATPYPFHASPMGTLGTAHTAAEFGWARALARRGVHTVVSTAATKSYEQIMQNHADELARLGGVSPSRLFFQFYMPTDRTRAMALINTARTAGYKGLFLTVDTPVLGKRTADRRLQAEEALAAGLTEAAAPSAVSADNPFAPAAGARVVPGQLSAQTTWDDLEWIRKAFGGPIVIKGVQCAEDVRLAAEYGCDGVLLSNHGGRQLHSAPSALMTLLEVRAYCPEVLEKLEVYVDGGLRDGADILKAICLGAKSVGVARPFYFAMAAYGTHGVEKCVDILAEELHMAMRLVGITSLNQARPEMVNTSSLLHDMWRPEGRVPMSRL